MRYGAGLAVWVLTTVSVVCLTSNRGVSQDAVRSSQVADALAAYERIASVLQSPRCLNCHPRSDRPTQGDDRRIHGMNVQRGADGNGMPAMRCSTCHQNRNNDMAGIPGASHWHLAPAAMGWVGLSKAELCRTLLDRRGCTQLVDHRRPHQYAIHPPSTSRLVPLT